MRRALTVALTVNLLTGCGGATGPEAIAGNYTLRMIDGQDLPFAIVHPNDPSITAEIIAGSVRLNNDNTFSASQTVEITESGTTTSGTVTFAGMYTLNGTVIALTSEGETFSGSIIGNTLTVIDDGFTFVYQK